MQRVTLDDVVLDYEVLGSGAPVVLIHNGVFADWFMPLLDQPVFVNRHRIVRYHRAGYAGSRALAGTGSFADHARHCQALLRHLGISSAHVVAHSSGGGVALQLAFDAPEVVDSLALLEPPLQSLAPTGPFAAEAAARFGAGDREGAVDTFLQGVFGPGYRPVLERAIPHAFDHAVRDCVTFFEQEGPALQQFPFTQDDARRITQPVLSVVGADSDAVTPAFRQRHELLLAMLPNVEPLVIPHANHLLDVQNPLAVAEGLAAFYAAHVDARS